MIYVLIALVVFAALCKVIMDTSAINKFKSAWWNKSQSWTYKWKNGDPNQGERFPGASTVFVSLSDGWHLAQHFFLLAIFLIPVVYTQCYPVIQWKWWMVTDFALIYVSFTFTFQIFYWIFNKK